LGHSILIIGWKKEIDPKDQKEVEVWICRNSYGTDFGMNGDFYVRMGYDDFGIESEVHSYEVQELSGWGSTSKKE
jgi:cathepsin C